MKKSNKSVPTIPSIPVQELVAKPVAQSTNVIYILLIIFAMFSMYLFLKVRNLEQKIATGTGTVQNPTQQTTPLSVDNLKKYAKDLKMNSGKFNKCIDSGEKKALVDADLNYGASVGIQGTPGFFINGRLLAGAFPFEYFKEVIDKEIQGKGSNDCNDYSENLKKYCQGTDTQNKPFNPEQKKIETGNSPSEGASDAKVTLVEFSDFQCPYCIRAYPTVSKIVKTYKNDLKLYFKNFPLNNIHPFAQKAAEAAECAKDQGKFWEYHNKIFELQAQPGN